MSTKTTQTNTNQYSPTGMSAYNNLIPAGANALNQFINDPMGSLFMQNLYNQGKQQIGSAASTQMRNILQPGLGANIMNPSAFTASQMGKVARNTSNQQGQLYSGLLQNAMNIRSNAANQALGFNPLQTGSTSTVQKTGLGTWLPQLVGAGLGMATGGLGSMAMGGIGALGGLGSSGFGQFLNSMPSNNSLMSQFPGAAGFQVPSSFSPFGNSNIPLSRQTSY